MTPQVIIVPVDGATNIKLEVVDWETLAIIYSQSSLSPNVEVDGMHYNCTGEECRWFDTIMRQLPKGLENVMAIAPVSRGASGGLVGPDNTLIEVPGKDLTLAYTQTYPEEVERRFAELAGSEEEYYLGTGSIRSFPGSIALVKRLVFEEMARPALTAQAARFGINGVLLAGHFLGNDYLKAIARAGNEHSYWTCHSGARDINAAPGTPSKLTGKIASFWRLVPRTPSVAYQVLGAMPPAQALALELNGPLNVVPGGHDTCLSHIPVMSTFYHAFPEQKGKPVIHLDAGTWTMIAQIGGQVALPRDGYKKGVIVQGTVDGAPVVTTMYAGGNDFKFIKSLMLQKGLPFGATGVNEDLLHTILTEADTFVSPNINPDNYRTGPFPNVRGSIVNSQKLFSRPESAYIIANLTTVLTSAHHLEVFAADPHVPVVLTAGGAKDPYFGRLLATVTGRTVYTLVDRNSQPITETTSLGAAIVGKAACLGVHPYQVDMTKLGAAYRKLAPFSRDLAGPLAAYRKKFMELVSKT
jgi:sugar (pentulose or hexulose) kinase